ncbi:unnamed protein product [Rotaria sp. Silwood1]|nr:unnamed protein product [Rotaria sp. Silwood1]CAF4973088.1 unnamed protein product [Rotaria sp. Silwood1]
MEIFLKLILKYFLDASLNRTSSSKQRHLIQHQLETYENEIPLRCVIRNDRPDLLSILFQFKSFTFKDLTQRQKREIFDLCLFAEHGQVTVDQYNIKWFQNQSLRPCGSIECLRLLIEYNNLNPFELYHYDHHGLSPFTLILEPMHLYLTNLHYELLNNPQIKFHTSLLGALHDLTSWGPLSSG